MQKLFKIFVAALIPLSSSISSLSAETTGIRPLSEIGEAATCNNTSVSMADLVIRNSIFYEKFSDVPFCGKIKTYGQVTEGKREGKWTVYHDNGQLHAKVIFRNNEKHGFYEKFNDTGLTIAGGSYKNDRKDGVWVELDRPTKRVKLKNIGYYVNGVRDGEWEFLHEGDKKCSTLTYQNGKPHGKFESYFRDTALSMRGEYAYGKVVGAWEVYYREPPHHLCFKGTPSTLDQCQNNKDGKALIIDPFRERLGEFLAQMDFIQLRSQNSCVVKKEIPSVFQ